MRYYVTIRPDGETGPYPEKSIRLWLRVGRVPRDAPVRREDEAVSRPASSVFPNEAPESPSTNAPSNDVENPYAPPKLATESIAPSEPQFVDPGSFGWGLVFGLCCGCFAYIGSLALDSVGSETQRGAKVGFIIQAVLGVVYKLVHAELNLSNHHP